MPKEKKEEMPSGDAQRQWFPEMIEMLRQQWHPGLSLAGLALLAARLDSMLQQIRKDRNIIPPMFTCPKCGERERSIFWEDLCKRYHFGGRSLPCGVGG